MKPSRQTLPPQKNARRARAALDGGSRLAANVAACATQKTGGLVVVVEGRGVGGGSRSLCSLCVRLVAPPPSPSCYLFRSGGSGGNVKVKHMQSK